MTNVVYIRDRSSGRVHIRVRVGDELQSFEADNADEAGEFDEITEQQMSESDVEALCRRCWPRTPEDAP